MHPSAISQLLKSKNIAGVLVLHKQEEDYIFRSSEDRLCPNANSSVYWTKGVLDSSSQCSLLNNLNAEELPMSLRFIDFPFPIFLIQNQTEIAMIEEKCYTKINHGKF